MSMPVTRSDFAKIGARFATEAIINEIDRLLPLAQADIELLVSGGYTRQLFQELAEHRDLLRTHAASRRAQQGARKGARKSEAIACEEGRLALAKGIAMAKVALTRRPVPEGADKEAFRKKATEQMSLLKALAIRNGRDAGQLRTRLEGLRAILLDPDYAPPAGGEADRAAFVQKLERIIATVTTHAENKKNLKDGTVIGTVDMDELDGRAYTNMRLLSQVGRAVQLEVGNKVQARAYALRSLNRSGVSRGRKGAPAEPAAPSPSA
jgi:hypothetical protein